MAINVNHLGSSLHVVGDTTTVNWNSLESHQALANLSIGGWIDLTALGITKEIVQSIISALSVVECCVLSNISPVTVVYRAVGRSLLRSIVTGVVRVRMAVSGSGTWVHGSGMIIVTTRVGSFAWCLSVSRVLALVLLRGSEKDRVVGVSLDVLLQVLRTLEGLPTEVAFVRLQWNVDSDVGGDVVTLDSCGSALIPSAGQVEVVRTLAADMLLADVLKERLCRCASLRALVPLACKIVISRDSLTRSLSRSGSSWGRSSRNRLSLFWSRHLEKVRRKVRVGSQ
jgi:hypothetical protein